jgi:hypothetical protein
MPGAFRRNRAMATVGLASAQLHQGDVDQSCATGALRRAALTA